MLRDTTADPESPAGQEESRTATRTPANAEEAVERLAARIRHVLRGGFYRVGQEISVEQLSADVNASPAITRCAAFRLHERGLVELLGSAPEVTPVGPAHVTATARVTLRLRERIALGVYPPGSVLPTQTALARSVGTSKATVANALEALAGEGWVAREPRRASTAARPAREIRAVRVVSVPL
ncbi:GntR family transcriptional regulator [Streptomyces winkii]|uniref:GntR family transcriptional regulator n=1 Tax=Streptomyces winkii TaxID=3051178 RepID=UPI0028D307A2|nr:GntR family transcriptional regulator [Streptomyces sp. DSM 40971]